MSNNNFVNPGQLLRNRIRRGEYNIQTPPTNPSIVKDPYNVAIKRATNAGATSLAAELMVSQKYGSPNPSKLSKMPLGFTTTPSFGWVEKPKKGGKTVRRRHNARKTRKHTRRSRK